MNETLAEEKDIFDTFRTNLSIAVKEAEGNAAVLEAINHALQADFGAAAVSPTTATPNASGSGAPAPAAPSAQPAGVPAPVGGMPEF